MERIRLVLSPQLRAKNQIRHAEFLAKQSQERAIRAAAELERRKRDDDLAEQGILLRSRVFFDADVKRFESEAVLDASAMAQRTLSRIGHQEQRPTARELISRGHNIE